MTAQNSYAWVLFLGIMFAFGQLGYSQSAPDGNVSLVERSVTTVQDTAPPLVPAHLDRKPWFYSLDEAMRNPEAVYKLSLQNERLSSFPEIISNMKNLQILNLSKNKIENIPESISSLYRLEVLILNYNHIRSLPEGMKEMAHLKELYLSKNKLTQIPAWMGGLGKLRQLDVSYNPVTTYEIERLRELLPKCEVTN